MFGAFGIGYAIHCEGVYRGATCTGVLSILVLREAAVVKRITQKPSVLLI